MKKRSKIRIAAFAAGLFTVMLIWGITATVRARAGERQLAAAEQRALTQLCEYLDNMETDLTKTLYAGSGNMLSVLSTDLCRQAAGAKSSLSALASGDAQLTNTYKLLSQAGEYTAALNRKAAAGGELTGEDLETLRELRDRASTLAARFGFAVQLLQSGNLTFGEVGKDLMKADKSSETQVSFSSSVTDTEESMTDFPTLIYDGPFSDNILQKESVLLKNAVPVSAEAAKKKAAEYLGTDEELVLSDGDNSGRLETYNFRSGKYAAAVTKNGGYLAYILSDETAGSVKMNAEEAKRKAEEFLSRAGYEGMEATYYHIHDGVCTVNYAYRQGSFLCYPDLIKVSVALDDGDIVAADATDYIMNHRSREIPLSGISAEQAGKVAPTLTVKNCGYAVIPTDGGDEAYTYELLCTAEDGTDVLVYKDIRTGTEKDILILLYSDNGTLTE